MALHSTRCSTLLHTLAVWPEGRYYLRSHCRPPQPPATNQPRAQQHAQYKQQWRSALSTEHAHQLRSSHTEQQQQRHASRVAAEAPPTSIAHCGSLAPLTTTCPSQTSPWTAKVLCVQTDACVHACVCAQHGMCWRPCVSQNSWCVQGGARVGMERCGHAVPACVLSRLTCNRTFRCRCQCILPHTTCMHCLRPAAL